MELINSDFHPFLTKAKSSFLKKDLETLDFDTTSLDSQQFSFEIHSVNAAIGCMYVSEGSALGGLLIGKHLKDCSNLNFIQRHYFFGTSHTDIINRWKHFKETVANHFGETSNKEEILNVAVSTFEFFGEIIKD